MQVGSRGLGRPLHPRLQGLSRSSHSLNVSVGLCCLRVLITLATLIAERPLQRHLRHRRNLGRPIKAAVTRCLAALPLETEPRQQLWWT